MGCYNFSGETSERIISRMKAVYSENAHFASINVMQCNVNFRKLLSAHKSHVRETSLFTGAILNQVRNSQTSRFGAR